MEISLENLYMDIGAQRVNTIQFDEMMYIVPACPEKTYFGLTAQWQLPPNVFPFFKI